MPRSRGHGNYRDPVQRRVGREETELATALRARGYEPMAQHRVRARAEDRYYDIDIVIPPLAIEVHTPRQAPWVNYAKWMRTRWLIESGWHVAYLWLRETDMFGVGALDSLTLYHYEVAEGIASEPYRVYDWDGCLRFSSWPYAKGLTVIDRYESPGPYCRTHRTTMPWGSPRDFPPGSGDQPYRA